MTTVREAWEMACPQCKRDSRLLVQTLQWARLVPDGTDSDFVPDGYGDTDWNAASACECEACGWSGTVAQAELKEGSQS